MNKSFSEAKKLITELTASQYDENVEMIVIPPALFVSELVKMTNDSSIKIGVQNSSDKENGAYTGELSASMASSVGVTYGIV